MKIVIENRCFRYSEHQCGYKGDYITALINIYFISLHLYSHENLSMKSYNYIYQVRSNFQFYK
jgi:hypothetical protein